MEDAAALVGSSPFAHEKIREVLESVLAVGV
jgi:hypothetical protein